MEKRALVTGVTGQDGAYLTDFLLKKGYRVWGIKRRSSSFNTGRVDPFYQDPHVGDTRFRLVHGDMTDATNLIRVVQQVQPDEIYNLAAQSHVQVSFETPEYTANADAIGPLRILEAIRILGLEMRRGFIRPPHRSFMGRRRRFRRVRRRPSIRGRPMPPPRFTRTGSRSTTVKRMEYMPQMAFSSIMKAPCAAKPL